LTPLERVAEWLAATPPAALLREHAWLYPLAETLHILGFVLLVGAVAMFDLRVLGLGAKLPVRALGRFLLPWSAGGFLLAAPTGALLFITQAGDFLANRVFLLKLALIGAALLNAALFHLGPWRSAGLDAGVAPRRARIQAAGSLLAWVAIIACGRLLAYV
jgi:hypothetical protein